MKIVMVRGAAIMCGSHYDMGYSDNISQDNLTVLFISALLYPQIRR